jgi:type IV pilus assembly protein PilF
MNTHKLIVTAMLSLFLSSACVSTTTGSVTNHERDDDDAAELNYQLGARYYRAEKYELARDRLQLAIEIKPKMAVAYTTLALTYEALDNERLAREAYENAVSVAPKDFEVQNAYAVFLCRQQDFDAAHKYFAKAAEHPENDASENTLTNAGVCMMQKPNFEAAEVFFREALDRKPAFGEALLQLCLLKFQQQDYLSARAFLQRFMSVNVTTAGVLYLASRIEEMLDNDRGRTEFEDRLIREFPTSPEARKVLGAS